MIALRLGRCRFRLHGAAWDRRSTTTKAVEKAFLLLCSNIWVWVSFRSNMVFIAREAVSNLDPWTGKRNIVIDNNAIELHDSQLESH